MDHNEYLYGNQYNYIHSSYNVDGSHHRNPKLHPHCSVWLVCLMLCIVLLSHSLSLISLSSSSDLVSCVYRWPIDLVVRSQPAVIRTEIIRRLGEGVVVVLESYPRTKPLNHRWVVSYYTYFNFISYD